MSSFLYDAALVGISRLDKDAGLAKELSTLDIETILKEDIHQICEAMTFSETVRVMSLGARIKMGGSDVGRIKEELKEMAKAIEKRVISKQGKLKLPSSCRDLLFNL
ncbi:MAG: hypothetical protein HQL13_04240 [Candidatus Omnitrophica bacterium]|nr:hypothetical protein [Candidatus Omnitrophota bacterium]